jgi:hypothetical protein
LKTYAEETLEQTVADDELVFWKQNPRHIRWQMRTENEEEIMFQKRTSPVDYTFTDFIAVAAFSVIAVIVTVNGGLPQKALFSFEPAGAPKEVPLMSISQRNYVEVDHWRAPVRNSINPYGSTTWLRGGPSPAQKVESARLTGVAVDFFNPFGSTAWVIGNPSDVGKTESARLSGMAGEFINPYGSTAWVRGNPSDVGKAEAARLSGMASEFINPYGSTVWVRGNPAGSGKAEDARLSGMAGEFINPYGSTAWVRGGPSKAAKTEAARLSGLAGEFINPYGSTAWLRHEPSVVMLSEDDMAEAVQLQALVGGFESSETTIAARLLAAGKAFGIIPHYISVELASFSDQ